MFYHIDSLTLHCETDDKTSLSHLGILILYVLPDIDQLKDKRI